MNPTDCSSLPIVFLTWFRHRRTTEIALHLGIELVEFTTQRRGVARYVELTLRTISTLLHRRPRVVIVQSPSLVASLVVLALRPLLRYSLVVDAHNEAVEPYLHPGRLIRTLTYLVLRRADRIIVTNLPLADRVTQHGGWALVLPDGIPTHPPLAPLPSASVFHIAVISTFAGDEPLDAVFEAARRIGTQATFSVTGNSAKLAPHLRAALPPNVTLTGFLEESAYWSLLAGCDAVIDLTTMENCLVCGAYEALAVGTPLILSNNQASMQLFHDAAVFTDNTPDSIAAAIRETMESYETFKQRMPAARVRIERLWQAAARELVTALRCLTKEATLASPPEST